MRIPVLAVLGRQEPLVESASASFAARAPEIPVDAADAPFPIDPRFPAVPLGHKTGGVSASLAEMQPDNSEQFVVRAHVEVDDLNNIPTEQDGVPIFADPKIAPFLTCGGSAPLGNAATVAAKLNHAALAARGLDGTGVALAILDTGINLAHLTAKLGGAPRFDAANSWNLPGSPSLPGAYPVDHGTMCAFDALIMAPKATILDIPVLAGSAPGGSVAGRTLSVAVQGFAQLIAFWGVAFATGGAGLYKALVVSNSWGIFHPSWDFPPGHPGRYIDNPRHPFQLLIAALAATNADILFAAGNCGAQCADGRCQGRTTGAIMGASASKDVLTLAGCDTQDKRVGYSSQGPSIAGMFQQKPDVTTYTHFLGSEAFGAGSADSGTSASCPVAAGGVAALRSKLSPVAHPPANLFQQLRTTAKPVPGQTGWNGDYGFGLMDLNAAATSLGV
jgi:hypothetical protein